MTTRRTFLFRLIPAAGLAVAAGSSFAAGPEKASETDPTAAALGYKADASKVDKAKFPKYAAGQACSSCTLYQGKAGEAWGPCPALANKLVAAKGWCSAYAKKG
ncbi:high-potential iron-sulfur protein [Chitinimonas sp.]|uniref:high-potential iron-sulfur protein n=1 Tax=Chitinimonas sp. TaxID=1934313 RepID=UPI0035B19CB3